MNGSAKAAGKKGKTMNNRFANNLKSLSRTQKRIARRYAKWAAEGGARADEYAAEAKRLRIESIKYNELAEREMNG